MKGVECWVAQSCWLCDRTDYSLPGSSVHEILQARILEWTAISSSRGSSQPRGWICVSCVSCIDRQILYHWTAWQSQRVWSESLVTHLHCMWKVAVILEILCYISWPSQVVLIVKNLPANTGDTRDAGLILRFGRSPGGGHDYPLKNSMDREAWKGMVRRVAKSQIWQKQLSSQAFYSLTLT